MHYLFYGEDSFSFWEKVRGLEAKFKKEVGSEADLIKLDGAVLTKAKFIDAVLAQSLFCTKKIVEIRNLQIENSDNDLKKYIAGELEHIPATTLVLFLEEGNPDARGALFKVLNKPKIAFNFPAPSEGKLFTWIKSRCIDSEISIDTLAATKLIEYVGPDFWRLANEIDKLVLYKQSQGGKNIEIADIEKMVSPDLQSTVFQFTESLAVKNAKIALKTLQILRDAGEADQMIFSMIVYQYRQLLVVEDLTRRGVSAPLVAKEAGIHPFAAKKALGLMRNYSDLQLRFIFNQLKEFDVGIKSGRFEMPLALDLLVAEICRK